ncbi:hypothetical protein [Aquimarina sp. AU474]|uniref:hypothetical protein n=1 Tax=Aquimarina sp. AU474 TaxID=2108529 RepID=UPI000D69E5D6|nr:hypothetical protein [Aquimarina sp. AU474]
MKTIVVYIITGIVVSFFLRTSIKDDLEVYDHFEIVSDIQNNFSDPTSEDTNDIFFNESNLDPTNTPQLSSIEINVEEE